MKKIVHKQVLFFFLFSMCVCVYLHIIHRKNDLHRAFKALLFDVVEFMFCRYVLVFLIIPMHVQVVLYTISIFVGGSIVSTNCVLQNNMFLTFSCFPSPLKNNNKFTFNGKNKRTSLNQLYIFNLIMQIIFNVENLFINSLSKRCSLCIFYQLGKILPLFILLIIYTSFFWFW